MTAITSRVEDAAPSAGLASAPRHVQKVLHVIPSVGPLRGGPSTMVRTLARELLRQGINTHVVTTDDNGAGTLPVRRGVPLIEDGVTFYYFRRQTRFYTFSWPLGTWLARHVSEYDVVHIHALFSFATIPAAFWAWRFGVPYIVRPLGTLNQWGMTNRRPWLKRLSFDVIERRVLTHAALIHYTSEQERLEAEALRLTTPGTVLANAVPDRPLASRAPGCFRARWPQLRDRRIVLFLSRLDKKKGLDLLLQAFTHVKVCVPDAALVIGGNGDEQFTGSLRTLAASLGITGDLVWAGYLDDERKSEAFADADLFVLPSYSENFGNAAAEAMAAGLPVVVSDRVGLHEDVTAAGAGLVVPCDVATLAAAIATLLGDGGLRAAMGRAGQLLARQRYSSAAVTGRLIDVYNQVYGQVSGDFSGAVSRQVSGAVSGRTVH